MKYKLRKGQETFEVVDGSFVGQKYQQNTVYNKIPPAEKHRFEAIIKPVKKKEGAKANEKLQSVT